MLPNPCKKQGGIWKWKNFAGHLLTWVEMGLDPNRAYFWPAVNKRLPLTHLLFDPTQRDFFWSEAKKIEKFVVFKLNFPNPKPNLRCLTQLDPSHKKVDPDPSLDMSKTSQNIATQCSLQSYHPFSRDSIQIFIYLFDSGVNDIILYEELSNIWVDLLLARPSLVIFR